MIPEHVKQTWTWFWFTRITLGLIPSLIMWWVWITQNNN